MQKRQLLIHTERGRGLFRQRLLHWYDGHKRDLPWRMSHDPYHVWLSEIMLQQTRVTAVLEHYQRFLKRFPTIEFLARARLSSVLAVWSGLGYYRRARMLHAAAKKVVEEFRGKLPARPGGLRTLPGIGRYTAAAIASIAFNEPVAVVDGNVKRVLQRVLGETLTGEELWSAAERVLSRRRSGDFNQAIMELGATVCLPRRPKCLLCPVLDLCVTRGAEGREDKTADQKKRKICYALDCQDGSVFLVRRPEEASLMPGMWELPEICAPNREPKTWMTFRHSITVTDYLVGVAQEPAPSVKGYWVRKSRLPKLPLTGLTRKILRAAKII
jgi:A/G-specific adenine glycosylase